jgi:hypothetical protein
MHPDRQELPGGKLASATAAVARWWKLLGNTLFSGAAHDWRGPCSANA